MKNAVHSAQSVLAKKTIRNNSKSTLSSYGQYIHVKYVRDIAQSIPPPSARKICKNISDKL